jgi:sugar (pentulose or hexulose) kinase
MGSYFLGIDVGTQGVRIVLLDQEGNLAAQNERTFALSESSREEQSPELWWESCVLLLKDLVSNAGEDINLEKILAISVTSTSGTVIPLDGNNSPLHNAIMYSDKRSAEQAVRCTEAAIKERYKGFTAFNSSTGLAKMVWFAETYPQALKYLHRWVHAADYITRKLSNRWGITDYTNAFKSGYDLHNLEWPPYLCLKLPLKSSWLPEVVPSGTVIGKIDSVLAAELGLSPQICVTAGITDGCASQIASGAAEPGRWNTTIGTTMVIKGVTEKEISDPEGRIYSHRHPAGYWMPGGASNTGADWITNEFGAYLEQLNRAAEDLIPTSFISYPLRQKGERFPMIAPHARGFEQSGLSDEERFTANMEGVAYLERYAFELISQLSGENINAVYTAGGGSNSAVWLKIRSNVLNLPVYKMKHISGAVGAAILASSNTWFKSLTDAVKVMTVIDQEIFPENGLVGKYEENYRRFLSVMKEKGYIKDKGHIGERDIIDA